MVSCSVKSCKNYSLKRSMKNCGITYHLFPKDGHLKSKWIDAARRSADWFPGPRAVVCSAHFTEECFNVSQQGRRRMFDDALPTLKLELSMPGEEGCSPRDPLAMPAVSATVDQHKNTELIRVKKVAAKRKKIIASLRSQNFRLKHKLEKMSSVLKILSNPQNKADEALTRKQATVVELFTNPENRVECIELKDMALDEESDLDTSSESFVGDVSNQSQGSELVSNSENSLESGNSTKGKYKHSGVVFIPKLAREISIEGQIKAHVNPVVKLEPNT